MKYVEIAKGSVAFNLIQLNYILINIKEISMDYCWSLQIIEGEGEIEDIIGMAIVELENYCQKSERGFITDLNTIIRIAEKCSDIIEVLLIACKNENAIPKAYIQNNWEDKCDIIISLEDSSMWQLYSNNEKIMQVFLDFSNLT